jgi:hypothetical protein
MPDENEVTRIGRPDYGPPLIDPAETVAGYPAVRPRKDRSGLIVGLIALVATMALAAVAAATYFLWPGSGPKAQTVGAPSAAATSSDWPSEAPSPSSTADDVTTVGSWGTAEDGVKIRVSKLGRGRVSDIASGGHPGDSGVVVTVQIENGGSHRLDLSQLRVEARLGVDGREADEVFQDGFGGTPDGSLAVGRTSTSRYMFAADSAAELKHVAIDVAPGYDYTPITYEGSA